MRETGRMADLVERLLRLWTQPVDGHPDPKAVFGQVYADPVIVNGVPMTLAELTDRARSLQRAFDGLSMTILDQIETANRIVLAFMMHGCQTGTYVSPLGEVSPTGRQVRVRTIDVLTIQDGLISAIWVASDELGLLSQLNAATLTDQSRP